jgi:RimJ/RimL family protein N-acetyltransferase
MGPDESWLVVTLQEVSYAGSVNWRPQGPFGNYEIGIVLLPEYRGRGIGTEAQRLLVEYLFRHSLAHRLQAGTEVDNLAEQRALEKVGFRREGVMRGVHFRAGQWRDGVMYGLLRDDRSEQA